MPVLRGRILTGLVISLLAISPSLLAAELSLAHAEELAITQSPRLSHHRTNLEAANERAVYEGSLPDPQFTVGVVNVPSDSFSMREEDMTMGVIGIRQEFPPGDTLALRERLARKEVSRQEIHLDVERRTLIRKIRELWLDLYLQEESVRVIDASRQLQARALAAAEARYRAAQEQQQTVLRNKQALARLEERSLMWRADAASFRAQLSRWLGDAADDSLPTQLPALPALGSTFDVARHPDWLYAKAGLEAAETEVEMARQDYKPGMMFDISYGARQSAPDGTRRSGTVTALVTVDMPIFRGKRQDRRLAEKQSFEMAAQFEADDMRRELEAMYRAARAEHDSLVARVRVFEQELVPYARREANVTAAGFARDTNELREARMKALDTELELVKLRVDLAKSHAELLYYLGEGQQ